MSGLLEAIQGFVEFETGKMTRAGGGEGNFTEEWRQALLKALSPKAHGGML